MSFTPGFELGDLVVVGLIGEVDWDEMDTAVQESAAFGLDGVSVMEGGFRKRNFSFPFMYYGYATPADRDFSLMQLELFVGTVETLNGYTPTFQIISLANVRLAGIKFGRPGWDALHGFWRQIFLRFEQLAPVPSIDSFNLGGGGGTLGG